MTLHTLLASKELALWARRVSTLSHGAYPTHVRVSGARALHAHGTKLLSLGVPKSLEVLKAKANVRIAVVQRGPHAFEVKTRPRTAGTFTASQIKNNKPANENVSINKSPTSLNVAAAIRRILIALPDPSDGKKN